MFAQRKGELLGAIGIICLVLLLVPTVAVHAQQPGPAKPIKIGALLPITGDPIEAVPLEKGLRFKLKEIGWKVAGRDIELVVEDSAASPTISVDKARKLVEADKVDAILGPLFGHEGIAVASYTARSRTPLIFWSTQSIEVLKQGGNNVFLTSGTQKNMSYISGKYAFEELGYRTLTVMYSDYVSGENFTGGAIQAFQEKGGTAIQKQPVPIGTLDYLPYLAALKKSDALLFWFVPPDFIRFITQYRTFGSKMPLLPGDGSDLTPPVLEAVGEHCVGLRSTFDYSPLLENPSNKEFVNAWVKEYNSLPGIIEYWGYVAGAMFLEAVKATGGNTTQEEIINALRKIKVKTPSGLVSYTREGLGVGDVYICEIVRKDRTYQFKIVKVYPQVVRGVYK